MYVSGFPRLLFLAPLTLAPGTVNHWTAEPTPSTSTAWTVGARPAINPTVQAAEVTYSMKGTTLHGANSIHTLGSSTLLVTLTATKNMNVLGNSMEINSRCA